MTVILIAPVRDSQAFRPFLAGTFRSLACRHPWRFAWTCILWLWRRCDCPLLRMLIFGLLTCLLDRRTGSDARRTSQACRKRSLAGGGLRCRTSR